MKMLASACGKAAACVVAASLIAGATPARAMSMAPLEMELTAAGSGARTQFQIGNNSNQPLPVEISVERLSYDESGRRLQGQPSDDLAIFPVTAMIPPGGTQTFRVQYVGAPEVSKSLSFLVNARQLPVRMKSDGKSHVQVVGAFGAILNVAPLTGTSHLKLVSSTVATTAAGKPALAILVENPTNVHALIANASLRVGNQTVNSETIRTLVGFGVVGPNKRRRFVVPLIAPASGTVSLDYRPSQK